MSRRAVPGRRRSRCRGRRTSRCRRRRRAPAPCTGSARDTDGGAGTATSVSSWARIACSNADEFGTRFDARAARRGCGGRSAGPAGRRLGGRSDTARWPRIAQRCSRNGCSADPSLSRRHHITVLARRQAGIEQTLLGRQPELLEPGRLDPSRRPAIQHVERGAAPQLQRPPERHRRPIHSPSTASARPRAINSSNRRQSRSSVGDGRVDSRPWSSRSPRRRGRGAAAARCLGSVSATTPAGSPPTTPQPADPPTTRHRRAPPTPTTRPGHVVGATPRCRRPVTGRAARSPPPDCQHATPGCQRARYRRDTTTTPAAVPAAVNVEQVQPNRSGTTTRRRDHP